MRFFGRTKGLFSEIFYKMGGIFEIWVCHLVKMWDSPTQIQTKIVLTEAFGTFGMPKHKLCRVACVFGKIIITDIKVYKTIINIVIFPDILLNLSI